MKILSALKHVFIPHEHNDYKPHFFREFSIAVLLGISLFLLGVSFGSSFIVKETVLGANITASVLIDLTNESRLAYNEVPLTRNTILDHAAQLKAEDMINEGYFSHDSPKGVTPWHWFNKAGYVFLYAGENLAINFTDATAVRDAWLASPKHRDNLLDVKFKEIGMATLDGLYKGDQTIYVVQLFGTPAVPKVSAVTTPVETGTTTQEVQTIESPGMSEIKGDTAVSPLYPYESLIETKHLAIVKNNNAEAVAIGSVSETPEYTTWYERALFGGSYYVQLLYKALFVLVLLALILMIIIEVRRQHWKHIAYGLGILLVLTLCILINQTFF